MASASWAGLGAYVAARRFSFVVGGALLLGLMVRLALAPTPGYDVEAYQNWTRGVYEHGITHAYQLELNPWYNYPPGYLYVLWGTAHVFVALEHQPDWNDALSAALLKLPPILAEVATAGAIYVFLRRRVRPGVALLSMSAYLFNPALIWSTAYWGGIDALQTAFLLLALMAAASRRADLSLPLATCSLLVKPLSAPAVLVVLAVALLRFDARRLAFGAAASSGLVFLAVLPFLLRGETHVMMTALSENMGNYAALSANAHNLWWLVTGGNVWRDDAVLALGPLSYRGTGLVIFGFVGIWCLAWMRPKLGAAEIFTIGAALQLSLFAWPTEVHENWVYPAFALLCVAAALRRSARPFYALLSVTFLINLGTQDLHLQPFWEADAMRGTADLIRTVNAAAYMMLIVTVTAALPVLSRTSKSVGDVGAAEPPA